MGYNKKEHLGGNIEAIRTAFELDRARKKATRAEKTILGKYSGFGGIKAILNPAPQETPASSVRPIYPHGRVYR